MPRRNRNAGTTHVQGAGPALKAIEGELRSRRERAARNAYEGHSDVAHRQGCPGAALMTFNGRYGDQMLRCDNCAAVSPLIPEERA